MKRLAFIFLVQFLAHAGFTQSIVSTDKLWNNYIFYYSLPGPALGTEHIRFTADTLIGGVAFKKVERSLDQYQQNWAGYGYIRENSSKQVFYRISPASAERMILDLGIRAYQDVTVYGLNTLYTNMSLDSMSFHVKSTDSILIGPVYRKRINLSWPGDTTYVAEQWIDSTGSLGGMLHNRGMYVGCDSYSLLCYYENGSLRYQDPGKPACYIATGIDERQGETVRLVPNPAGTGSMIRILGLENATKAWVYVYDPLGKLLVSGPASEGINPDVHHFSPGLYLYSIISADGSKTNGKLIVN